MGRVQAFERVGIGEIEVSLHYAFMFDVDFNYFQHTTGIRRS